MRRRSLTADSPPPISITALAVTEVTSSGPMANQPTPHQPFGCQVMISRSLGLDPTTSTQSVSGRKIAPGSVSSAAWLADRLPLQSNTFTATQVVTYDSGLGYQGSLGGYSPVYQIDFAVSIALNGGQTYQFFLDGPASANGSSYRNAFLHASNALLKEDRWRPIRRNSSRHVNSTYSP